MAKQITIDKSVGISLGLVITIIGMAVWFGSRNSQIDSNIESVQKDVTSIDEKVTEQSGRFELYLQSLNSVRTDSEKQFDQVNLRVDKVEDRVLLLESSKENND